MKAKAKKTAAKKNPAKKPNLLLQAVEKIGKDAALKEAGDLTGPFTVTAEAKAKTPEELRLKKNSARWKLMAYALKHPTKRLTRDELQKAVGAEQLPQALRGVVRYRFLAKAA
jgi:hypothetical protein